MRQTEVTLLIPTSNRLTGLAVTLAGLITQTYSQFRLGIAEQNYRSIRNNSAIATLLKKLELQGHVVDILANMPKQGMAQQRQFLLNQAETPYVWFLDDDLYVEPFVLEQLLNTIRREKCGFVGSAPIGLSYLEEERPEQQAITFWEGKVLPEIVSPGSMAWKRYELHNAANLWHVAKRMGLSPYHPHTYKNAWVGGCVLYDRDKLITCGGFSFWKDLPLQHVGEDVLAQVSVMATYGGCAIIPSGVYHLELVTTLQDRKVDAPHYLPIKTKMGKV